DVVAPPLAADLLDHHARDRECQVRVLPADRRRKRRLARGVEAAELLARRELERGPMVARLALQPGAVRQQLLDRDRAVIVAGGFSLEPRDVLRDRIVEPQLPLFAQ